MWVFQEKVIIFLELCVAFPAQVRELVRELNGEYHLRSRVGARIYSSGFCSLVSINKDLAWHSALLSKLEIIIFFCGSMYGKLTVPQCTYFHRSMSLVLQFDRYLHYHPHYRLPGGRALALRKGTVSRDFQLLFFFINLFLWSHPLNSSLVDEFRFCVNLQQRYSNEKNVKMPSALWHTLQNYYVFLNNLHFNTLFRWVTKRIWIKFCYGKNHNPRK